MEDSIKNLKTLFSFFSKLKQKIELPVVTFNPSHDFSRKKNRTSQNNNTFSSLHELRIQIAPHNIDGHVSEK
jgi:hypothetical protein